MIKKVVKVIGMKDKGSDLGSWLSRSPQERIEAVETLRKQFNGSAERLQRIITVIKQT